jgi:hypothetical protein
LYFMGDRQPADGGPGQDVDDEHPADAPGQAPQAPAGTAPAGEPAAPRGVKEVTPQRGARGAALRRFWPFVVLAVASLALVVGVVVVTVATDDPSGPEEPEEKAAPKGGPAGDLASFRDEGAGFTISFPSTWNREPTAPSSFPLGDQKLRLVLRAGGQDGLLIRAHGPEDAAQVLRQLGDGLKSIPPCGSPGSPCVDQKQVTVGGIQGTRVVYAVRDQAGGEDGVQVQYFLPQQGRLFVITLQAFPSSDFDRLGPLFAQSLNSFQPFEPGAAPATTTTTVRR